MKRALKLYSTVFLSFIIFESQNIFAVVSKPVPTPLKPVPTPLFVNVNISCPPPNEYVYRGGQFSTWVATRSELNLSSDFVMHLPIKTMQWNKIAGVKVTPGNTELKCLYFGVNVYHDLKSPQRIKVWANAQLSTNLTKCLPASDGTSINCLQMQ